MEAQSQPKPSSGIRPVEGTIWSSRQHRTMASILLEIARTADHAQRRAIWCIIRNHLMFARIAQETPPVVYEPLPVHWQCWLETHPPRRVTDAPPGKPQQGGKPQHILRFLRFLRWCPRSSNKAARPGS